MLLNFCIILIVSLFDPINIIISISVGMISKEIRQCIIGSIIAGILLRILVFLLALQDQSWIDGIYHIAGLFSTVCGSTLIFYLSNWFKRQKLKKD